MGPSEPLLKTQQVADALGISVSTIKRWVDAGTVRAARTVGRHRLITAQEALRLAREQGLPVAGLEGLARPRPERRRAVDDQVRGALATALREGRAEEARSLILRAHAWGGGAVVLADELIAPVMGVIGRDWEAGALDVFQEHRATRIVEQTLEELNREVPRPEGGPAPLALGATPEGNAYTLAGLLGELALRELGWEVINLGPCLPLSSLGRAVAAHRPRLAWLSVHETGEPERFLHQYKSFYKSAAQEGTAIILGGPALGPGLRARVAATGFGDRMGHLAGLARRLHPGPGATVLSAGVLAPPNQRKTPASNTVALGPADIQGATDPSETIRP
ncbi:MAG TPA: B12-binding domain-containing protein [Isosphaeraceae bacterium]